jgi:hypothetical protein
MRFKYLISPDAYRQFTRGLEGDDDRLVSIASGAKLSGLSERQIGYAIEMGRLQAYKLDQDAHGVLVQLSELLELPEPTTGRPPKQKRLTPEQLGHVI